MRYLRKKSNTKDITWKIFLATSIADLAGLHHGFSSGFASPIALEVTTQLHILNSVTFPIFSSITFATQAIGAVLSIYFYDVIGRKASIAIAAMISAVGWLMIGMGSTASVLIIGRAISGLGIGVQLYNTPSYVNDIAHYKSKGFYLSFFNFYIRFGVILVYLLGIFISFRYLAYCEVIINLLTIVGFVCIPYSPTWLASKGAERRARIILTKLRKEEDTVELEIATINTVLRYQTNMNFIDKLKLFRQWFYLKVLIIGQVYMLGIGFTALGLIHSYTSIILRGGILPPNVGALGVPILGITGAIMGIVLIDRLGRRKMMVISCVVIVLCYASLALYFTIFSHVVPCLNTQIPANLTQICKFVPLWPTVSVAVYAWAQAFGWGSVGYTFIGELFPTQVKGIISGIGILSFRGSLFLTVLISPYIGSIASFYSLTCLNLFSLIFVILFIPETKGRDAEEIEVMLRERTIIPNFPCYKKKRNTNSILYNSREEIVVNYNT